MWPKGIKQTPWQLEKKKKKTPGHTFSSFLYTSSKYAKQAVMVGVYPVHWFWSSQIWLNDGPPILSDLPLI